MTTRKITTQWGQLFELTFSPQTRVGAVRLIKPLPWSKGYKEYFACQGQSAIWTDDDDRFVIDQMVPVEPRVAANQLCSKLPVQAQSSFFGAKRSRRRSRR